LLFDPQTAGPLLIGVAEAELDGLLVALRAVGESPVVVGRAFEDREGAGVIHLR
jgi:selenophosphate synthase